jgi:hypothetical protein
MTKAQVLVGVKRVLRVLPRAANIEVVFFRVRTPLNGRHTIAITDSEYAAREEARRRKRRRRSLR